MPYFKESLYIDISIHAPHEGERQGVKNVERKDDNISIHAPHEGERRCAYPIWLRQPLSFQSTLPTRGSDLQIISENVFYDLIFQSTLPTRGSDDCVISLPSNT